MTAYEREQSLRELFANPFCKYNYYQLNASNPMFKALISAYADHIGMREPLDDARRVEAEQLIWNFVARYFRKYDRKVTVPKLPMPDYTLESGVKIFLPMPAEKHIARCFFGWQREHLQIFVNDILKKEKSVELFRKEMEVKKP